MNLHLWTNIRNVLKQTFRTCGGGLHKFKAVITPANVHNMVTQLTVLNGEREKNARLCSVFYVNGAKHTRDARISRSVKCD